METRESRPNLPQDFQGEWHEVVIEPFCKSMTDRGAEWLQWGPEECRQIPAWLYCLLGLMWPLLRLIYRKALLGQSTDY